MNSSRVTHRISSARRPAMSRNVEFIGRPQCTHVVNATTNVRPFSRPSATTDSCVCSTGERA